MQVILKPLFALALTATLAASAMAAEPGHKRHSHHNPLERMKSQLSLTDAQVAQLKPTFDELMEKHKAQRQAFRARMDSILTADQKSQLEEARSKHERPHLSLTDDQKAQLKSFREQNRGNFKAERDQTEAKILSVLTPEQQSRYKEMKEKRREHWRGHHRHHRDGAKEQSNA